MNRPSVGDVVADNLRTARYQQRLSAKAVEEALDNLGVAMSRSSVAKSEHTDRARRHVVDVEELAALALVLETSPTYLMTPSQDIEQVTVTPERDVEADVYVRWLAGDRPLWSAPEPAPSRLPADAATTLPEVYAHPSLEAAGALGSVMASALFNRFTDRTTPAEETDAQQAARERRRAEAAEIRQHAARAQRYAELLAEELEAEPFYRWGGGSV